MLSLVALALAFSSCAFTAVAFVIARRELRALVRVEPKLLKDPLLVVIPARNEAARIEPTLAALRAQRVVPGTPLDVVVVDDRSTDDTAAIAERFEARVVRVESDPPAGTFGKPRALQLAVDDARARNALPGLVLFLDADVVLADHALGALVDAFHRSKADALSGLPKLECQSVAEQLLVPTLGSVVTGRFRPSKVHDANDETAFLNGQCILISSQALDDVGGWQSVSSTVLEDVALARELKTARKAVRLADLRSIASTRMYTSFREIRSGFGKNAIALLGKNAASIGVLSLLISLIPWLALLIAANDGAPGSLTHGLAIDFIVANVILALWTRRLAKAPLWPAFCLPIVYAGVALVLREASKATSISWRGRTYSA